MVREIPEDMLRINTTIEEYEYYLYHQERRLYLLSEIMSTVEESDGEYPSKVSQLVTDIFEYNREDNRNNIPIEERKPIILYINSPGGSVTEGFSLISAIEVSRTPIYTVNIGQWASMAFLIGITGHKRYSLPYMTFLMHDGTNFTYDTATKAQDKMKFDERFNDTVVKHHVLAHSDMEAEEYNSRLREEYYMLPEDALKKGFIDKIVDDANKLDAIL